MSESKGKILFVILAILLLLFGGGTILYPSLNGLWVERTMHRDSEDFLLLLEEDAERTAEENSHVIPGDPGTRETAEPQMPLEHTQLWLDMKAYNEAIFREGQKGLSDPSAYEDACFRLSDYGLDSEVFGVLSIPKLNLQMSMLSLIPKILFFRMDKVRTVSAEREVTIRDLLSHASGLQQGVAGIHSRNNPEGELCFF